MPKKLKRITGRGDLHFITFCCYQRRALLGSVRARNLAVQALGEVRAKYRFSLVGYVIMPEHVHLLIRPGGPGLFGSLPLDPFSEHGERIPPS